MIRLLAFLFFGRDRFMNELMTQRKLAIARAREAARLLERACRLLPNHSSETLAKLNAGCHANDRLADLINQLRAEEGNALTLVCDNPEFHGEACSVFVTSEATGWKDKRYDGANLLACLEAAAKDATPVAEEASC
jgi:hypothetical protein